MPPDEFKCQDNRLHQIIEMHHVEESFSVALDGGGSVHKLSEQVAASRAVNPGRPKDGDRWAGLQNILFSLQ